MKSSKILIRGGRIIDPSRGLDRVGDILVQDGTISLVGTNHQPLPDPHEVIDAQGMVVCPGFIDLHCHLREPGFEDKETIATGLAAAARGGFTTVCAMPNTSPPIDNVATIQFVLERAAGHGVRLLPIACVTKGRQGRELAEMGELAQAGAVAFSDDGSPVSDPHIMRTALAYSAGFGVPIINHCEELSLSRGGVMNEGWLSSRLGLRGMPGEAEEAMAARDIGLVKLAAGRLHLAHISTEGTLGLVSRAKEWGLAVTAEVTPHHLTLTHEAVLGVNGPSGPWESLSPWAYDTRAKVSPPLRTAEDIRALISGLREGVIDAIATDHAPHTIVDKECTFDEAAFGISGLETALGLLLTLVHSGELPLPILIERLTLGPARVLGHQGARLGTLKPGSPADIAIFDLQREWKVDSSSFASKGKNTPLEGRTLRGKVVCTIARGKVVFLETSTKTILSRGARPHA